MKNFQKGIDDLVTKILNEEIDAKVKQIMENKGEWEEELHGGQSKIDVAEPKGKITAADFKKLRDSKSKKTEVDEFFFNDEEEEEAEELSQNEPTYVGRGLGDDRLDVNRKPRMIASFDDVHGWYDDIDRPYRGKFDFDYDEEEFEDFPSLMDKYGDKQYWFDPKHGEKFFNRYKKMYGGKPFRVRVPKGLEEDEEIEDAEELSQNEPTYVGMGLKDNKIMSKLKNALRSFNDEDEEELDIETDWSRLEEDEDMDFEDYDEMGFDSEDDSDWQELDLDDESDWSQLEEDEATEGNAFSGARAKAIEDGKDTFEVDGKTYKVKGESSEGVYESEDKWIQKTDMKKGALHKKLGIPEGQKIPKSKLNSIKKDLMAKAKGDKKLSAADSKLLKQVNMALTLGHLKESKNSLKLTENELINMIEKIVLQEQEKSEVKDKAEKDNFKMVKPQGLKKTEKAQGESKKENDDYTQDVVKKMKDYMKDMYMGGKGYEANPDDFPQSNYDMEKEHNEMKYHPSDAVEEYIEAFAYPGMTNLVYDEIKPEDKNIEKQIKGDSKNGNAVTGKDGKALGNVSKRSQKTGERFKKNFDENLYGAEQQKASYKRQPQPVDVAGDGKLSGSLKSKKGSSDESKQGADKSSSINKATKILNTLESTEDKATKIIKEDLQKMMNLISYDRKTQ